MRQYINFNWNYIDDFKEEYLKKFPKKYETIDIPHTVKELPYNYFNELDYQKIVTYRKVFDIDENIKDKIITILFEAFMVKAKIYLNDNYLGEYVSLYKEVEIDISKYVKQKNNELIVILDSHEDKSIPPFGFVIDYLLYGGIYREVSINTYSKVYLERVLVSGNMDGLIEINPIIKGDLSAPYTIKYELYYKNILLHVFNSESFKLDEFDLWDIDNPSLYTLKTSLVSKYGTSTYETRFGFRSISFKKDGFYLNNKKIKLYGLNRHQAYPYVGYAMPKAAQIDDANILKYDAGINVVRTSHYPQSKHFLNRCDEIGLLVINEIPGWQYVSKDNEVWRNHHYDNVKQMVIEEYNHPSLIAHGVRIDESMDDHELYLNSNKIVHDLDHTRPTLGVRNFKNSELLEDIYAYNDFICKDLSKGLEKESHIKSKGKPYLVTEYLGHMEPTKATDSEKQRIHHALRHALVVNDNFKHNNCVGAIGWCFVDYNTHVDFGSGDRICPHGVFDMYRNPKYAAYIYQSQQDEIPVLQVLNNMKPGDLPQSVYDDIYIATNADRVDLYKNNEFVASYTPNTNEYKYMKHPLIRVDDIIGDTFKDERFSKKDQKLISKTLTYLSLKGLLVVKFKHYLLIAKIMLKYHLKYEDFVDLYNNNVSNWGGKVVGYTFKAIKNNEVVKEVTLGPSFTYDLSIKATKHLLVNEETYDVSRVTLKYIDQNNNLMNYANKVVSLEANGPIKIIGPSLVTLLGGQLSIYVRSLNLKGKATLKIKCENIQKEIEFEVK